MRGKGDQDTGDNYYQDMRGKAMSTYVAIAKRRRVSHLRDNGHS